MSATVAIASEGLSAEIATLGAELQALRTDDGRDLLWNGDPKWWTGRAPILFPVVGACNGDGICVDGRTYPMAKHGFARRRDFAVAEQADDRVTFRLEADEATRAQYPFDFRLDITFSIEDAALSIVARLHNPGDATLPASFGFHPAFLRQTPDSVSFAEAEPEQVRRIGPASGLLLPGGFDSPVEGRTLAIEDSLFEQDALIWDAPRSRAVRYGDALEVSFPDMPMLGIWTKPGAPFLCIEPWHGIADPQNFEGELRDKPGIVLVEPGGTHRFTMRIALS